MISERIRKTLFFFLLFSFFTFLCRMRNRNKENGGFEDETEADVNSRTFLLEHCSCRRTLLDVKENRNNSVQFSDTTCGRDAFRRGANQKVAGFSFYGNTSSSVHKAKKYFEGIEENLRLVKSQYGDDWSMRLYYDLAQSDELQGRDISSILISAYNRTFPCMKPTILMP